MFSISGISSVTGSYATQQVDRRPPQPPKGDKDPLTSVAKALGLSSDEVKSQLSSGKSLTDIASAQGLSHDDLIAAIRAGKPVDAVGGAAGVDKGDDTVAEKIAARKGGPGGPPPGGPRGELAGMSDDTKLQQLSSLLDTDSETVRNSSASEVVKQLQNKNVDLSKLRSFMNSGDLFDYSA